MNVLSEAEGEIMSFYQAIERGTGSTKYYSYWTGGIRLTTKKAIKQALDLKFKVLRQDRLIKDVEEFNYKSLCFEKVRA